MFYGTKCLKYWLWSFTKEACQIYVSYKSQGTERIGGGGEWDRRIKESKNEKINSRKGPSDAKHKVNMFYKCVL